jgi:hypothetical protein
MSFGSDAVDLDPEVGDEVLGDEVVSAPTVHDPRMKRKRQSLRQIGCRERLR